MTSKEFDIWFITDLNFIFVLAGGDSECKKWSLVEVYGTELTLSKLNDYAPDYSSLSIEQIKNNILHQAKNEKKQFLGKDSNNNLIRIYNKLSTNMDLVYEYFNEFDNLHIKDNLTELLYEKCIR